MRGGLLDDTPDLGFRPGNVESENVNVCQIDHRVRKELIEASDVSSSRDDEVATQERAASEREAETDRCASEDVINEGDDKRRYGRTCDKPDFGHAYVTIRMLC